MLIILPVVFVSSMLEILLKFAVVESDVVVCAFKA